MFSVRCSTHVPQATTVRRERSYSSLLESASSAAEGARTLNQNMRGTFICFIHPPSSATPASSCFIHTRPPFKHLHCALRVPTYRHPCAIAPTLETSSTRRPCGLERVGPRSKPSGLRTSERQVWWITPPLYLPHHPSKPSSPKTKVVGALFGERWTESVSGDPAKYCIIYIRDLSCIICHRTNCMGKALEHQRMTKQLPGLVDYI